MSGIHLLSSKLLPGELYLKPQIKQSRACLSDHDSSLKSQLCLK